ncbi:MAG: uroporphyrin-III C-methyltransferase [Mycobacterium sp.]|nr:uroporphyrin-III C-methyltransferase [Mycobacterium sp.]
MSYSVDLPVAGRPVLVAGAGARALATVEALRRAGAVVTVAAPEVTAALADLADRGLVTLLRRVPTDADVRAAWLVHPCADEDADAAVTRLAAEAHVLCLPVRRAAPAPRDPLAVGHVALVGGGPGDPGLLTVRGRELLLQADVVVADRLAPLAALAGLDVEVIDAGKTPRGRAMPQEEINEHLVRHALAGRRVVRLKGGDPYVLGRGGEELDACVAAGITVEVVPGVTSAIAVPGLAGVPVTHRGLAQAFTVASGHVPPGDPRSELDWAALARTGGTLVLLMAVQNLGAIAAALADGGLPLDTPVAIVEDHARRTIAATLADADEAVVREGVRPPAVVVIGAVAARARALVTAAAARPSA